MADEAASPTEDDLARAEAATDRVLNDLVAELGAPTLAGDVHNKMMAHIRTIDGFAALSEFRQDAIIRATDDLARHLVIGAVETVADKGFKSVSVTLGKFTLKGDELKGTFEARGDDDVVLQLARHQDASALVVFADAEAFLGARGNRPRATPDEPDLPLEQPTPEATGMDDTEQQELEGDSGFEEEEANDPPVIPAADPVAAAAGAAWSEEDGAGEPVKA